MALVLLVAVVITALNLSAVVALTAGVILALLLPADSFNFASKQLLKISVIGLGFGVSFEQVIKNGPSFLILTLFAIAGVVCAGLLLKRIWPLEDKLSALVIFGTAICGGSAIAALSGVIAANNKSISTSLAIVFSLNAIGIAAFPYIGTQFGLTQTQFGIWSALALHDTSAVVAACSSYGDEALQTGTLLKLTRALWIMPLVLGFALLQRKKDKAPFPYFLIFFVLATVITPHISFSNELYLGAKKLIVLSIFLIGYSLNKSSLAEIRLPILKFSMVLWLLTASISLGLITTFI